VDIQVASIGCFQRGVYCLCRCAVRRRGEQSEIDAAIDLIGPGIRVREHILRISRSEVSKGIANRLTTAA
jgi:hypothetical protein